MLPNRCFNKMGKDRIRSILKPDFQMTALQLVAKKELVLDAEAEEGKEDDEESVEETHEEEEVEDEDEDGDIELALAAAIEQRLTIPAGTRRSQRPQNTHTHSDAHIARLLQDQALRQHIVWTIETL